MCFAGHFARLARNTFLAVIPVALASYPSLQICSLASASRLERPELRLGRLSLVEYISCFVNFSKPTHCQSKPPHMHTIMLKLCAELVTMCVCVCVRATGSATTCHDLLMSGYFCGTRAAKAARRPQTVALSCMLTRQLARAVAKDLGPLN